ncbi:MAG: TonB-dependent receptor [Candidatus Solibacter sp.]
MSRLMQSMFAIAVMLSICTPVYTQTDGVITGRVLDTSGAVVLGAAVTVTQVDLNFDSATVTNEEGLYRVQSLRPGPYRVTVVAAGFQRLIRAGIDLRTGDTLAIDCTLKVGTANETVEVTSEVTLLQTETSSTNLVMNGDYYYSLPIYQRRPLSILYFTPGVSLPYVSNGAIATIGNFHINGGRSSDIGYFEDGVMTTQDTMMGSIEEVKVLTTVPPAEYGHSAGGTVTVVKKFGTNKFHGMLSEFGRTRRMTHRKYFDQYRNAQTYPGHEVGDSYWFHMPDMNVTGPVYIPKVYDGRNRTFFMFAAQRQMESQAHQNPFTVPDNDMKNGTFTFGGIGQAIYDPRTTRQNPDGTWARDIFPGGIVPRSAFDPVAVKVLSFDPYRAPNYAAIPGTTGPSNNVHYSQVARQNFPSYAARIDQQFTSNVKSFLSYSYIRTGGIPSLSGVVQYLPFDPGSNTSPTYKQTYSLGTTWVISPSFLAETRFGYARSSQTVTSSSYMADMAATLGIPGLPPDTFPLGLYGIGQPAPSSTTSETLSARIDLSKMKGTHAFKFGYELMRYRGNVWNVGQPSGNFIFTGTNGLLANGTATPNTGNTFASFLVGSVASATFTKRLQASLPREFQHSAYLQDDWKISPNVTLNLGVRYTFEQTVYQKWGLASVWDPNLPDTNKYIGYTCPATGCKGAYDHTEGRSLYEPDKNNFEPRIGIAWHAMQRLVLRGGFGLSTVDTRFLYDNTDELVTTTAAQSAPTGDPRPLYQISKGPGTIVYPPLREDGSVPYTGTPGGHTATWVDSKLRSPYSMNWNFTMQYELSKNYALQGIYSGSGSVALTGGMEINTLPFGYLSDDPVALAKWIPTAQFSRPFPNWGNISYVGNYGHGTHHEGTVSLEKRYSKGVNFTVFYTLAKSIDGTATNKYLSTSLNKGRSAWDQRHTLSATTNYELPVGKGRRFMNKGGWTNALLGGFNAVLAFSVRSGGPLSFTLSGAPTLQYPSFMPNYGNVMLLKTPQLRDNWQDLGGDRFNQANQNNTWDCGANTKVGNDCFTYIPSYSMGTDGRNITDTQRVIAFSFSATKSVKITEALNFEFRYDFQNPFKWYTWNAPSTLLNLNSPAAFGKVTGDAGTANLGGQPLMNIGLALRW